MLCLMRLYPFCFSTKHSFTTVLPKTLYICDDRQGRTRRDFKEVCQPYPKSSYTMRLYMGKGYGGTWAARFRSLRVCGDIFFRYVFYQQHCIPYSCSKPRRGLKTELCGLLSLSLGIFRVILMTTPVHPCHYCQGVAAPSRIAMVFTFSRRAVVTRCKFYPGKDCHPLSIMI